MSTTGFDVTKVPPFKINSTTKMILVSFKRESPCLFKKADASRPGRIAGHYVLTWNNTQSRWSADPELIIDPILIFNEEYEDITAECAVEPTPFQYVQVDASQTLEFSIEGPDLPVAEVR